MNGEHTINNLTATTGTASVTWVNAMGENYYLQNQPVYVPYGGMDSIGNDTISSSIVQKKGIHPELYFKYIKKKFGMLERMKLDSRLKKLTKAFDTAVDNGQESLGAKLMMEICRESRESAIYAKGFKLFIERDDIQKFKHKIRGGHISDTRFKDYTRVIPKNVLKSKAKTEGIFDDYIIYHYWDSETEAKVEKKEKMTPDEKARMKDPILFGIIKETNRLYFIDEWTDELCDLSFEEIVDHLGKNEDDISLNRNPKLNV